jgi:hypothetical protein
MRSKILIGIVVLVGVVAIGVGVGWLAGRSPHYAPQPVVPETGPNPQRTAVADSQPTAPVHTQAPDAASVVPAQPVAVVQTSNVAQPIANASNVDTNWEDKIDEIVGSDEPDTNKVKELYALFPKLPPDGQEEVAQHLSNLVEDEDYAPLAAMLKNDQLPEGVLDELLADALNRPNTLKLPALLDVASDSNNPKSSEAKDLLELYLGEDYGNDWNAWGQHMTNWLQQNPD